MDDEELDFEEEDFGDIDSLLYENKDNSKVSDDSNNDQNNDEEIVDKTDSDESNWSDSVDNDKEEVDDQQEDKEMVDRNEESKEEQTDVFDQLESLLKAYEEPKPSPKPLSKSVAKPSVKPVTESTKPSAKPAPESTKPSAKPAPESSKPSAKPAPESTKPSAKPAPESSKPSAKPAPESSKPSAKPAPESAKPSAKPAPESSKPSAKPAPESTKPSAKPAPESSKPSAKPAPESTKPSAKPAPESSKPSAKPAPESSKPSAKPAPESAKPSAKPAPESSKPSAKPAPESAKPSAKPAFESSKPSAKPEFESSKLSTKPVAESVAKPSNDVSNYLNMSSNYLTSNNVLALTPTQLLRKKTVDLDKKFYDSIRIYLRSGKIIGYPEDQFKIDAKNFKLKDNKLFMNSKEVIETEKRQMDISVEFHVNPTAKSIKSRHRGVSATFKAIDSKYFWGTIKYDVENVINKCRICNPLDYDLMSHQLWKYIEIGFIESVLIVRDLNEKSSIFNCYFLKEISAIELSKHLLDLFKTYGTPNAIRIVLNNNLQKEFLIDFREYLRKGFMDFTEEFEFISQNSTQTDKIKLPMINIKIEDDVTKFPKSEKQLDTIYAAIGSNDNISLFFIFTSNKWLLNDSVYNSIATDIKNFTQKFSDWESRVSTLTLYFQISGINLQANEVEEEPIKEEVPHREKRLLKAELKRLETDFKPSKPSYYWNKETKKTEKVSYKFSESSEDSSDDDRSVTSSKHSVASNTKRRKSLETKEKSSQLKSSPKEFPLRDLLREKKKRESDESQEIQCIDIDDSSQHSLLSSQLGSDIISISSETRTPEPTHISETLKPMDSQSSDDRKTIDLTEDSYKYDPNGICQPCVVILNHFSQEYIEKAINGFIDLEECGNDDNPEVSVKSPEIIDESDNGIEGVEDVEQIRPQVMVLPSRGKDMNNMRNNSEEVDNDLLSVKSLIDEELEKRSKKRKQKKSVEFNLSESDSSSEEEKKEEMTSKSKQTNNKLIRTESEPKPNRRPTRTQTPSITKTVLTPKTQTKRKKNSSDSDYDIRKDLNVGTNSSKRVKKYTKNKSLSNSKSIEKREKPKNRLVFSSSDSESCDENKEKVNNNLNQTKEKTITNSVKKSGVIKCQFCDFTTNERGNYILHSAKHRNEQKKAICCQVCTQVFYNKDALERHKEEEHPPQFLNAILYGCEKCKNGFHCDSLQELDQHLMTHIEDLSYLKISSSKHRCSLCQSYTAVNMDIMATHMTQKHRMFKCAFDCPFVAPDFQSLERHAKSVHSRYGQPYECKYCDYNSAVFGALVQHKERTHVIEWTAEYMNKCGLCESVFNYDDTDNILEHLSSHTIDFTYFYCKSCNKKMRKVAEIKKHCTVQHGVGPADGIESHISNLNEMFDDLRKQLNDKNNKLNKINSTANETQNAIQGLMDEQFEAPEETDLVAAAFDIAMNGEAEDYQYVGPLNAPTISIPETEQTDEWAEIEENADGIWNPVDDSNQ